MIWYIHRGDDLSKDTRIPITLQGLYSEHEYETGDMELSGQLYESQEEYVLNILLEFLLILLINSLIGLSGRRLDILRKMRPFVPIAN